MKSKVKWILHVAVLLCVTLLFGGCEPGKDGEPGPAGADGTNGVDGVDGIDGLGFKNMAMFGTITVTYTGEDPFEGQPFEHTVVYPYTPNGDPEASGYTSYYNGEGDYYNWTFYTHRIYGPVDGENQDSYFTTYLYAYSYGEDGEMNQDGGYFDYSAQIQASNGMYFTIQAGEIYFNATGLSYNSGSGKIRYTLEANEVYENNYEIPLSVRAVVNATVYQNLGGS